MYSFTGDSDLFDSSDQKEDISPTETVGTDEVGSGGTNTEQSKHEKQEKLTSKKKPSVGNDVSEACQASSRRRYLGECGKELMVIKLY